MKKELFLFALIACINANAQDVIVKKDGSTILSKVLEVNPSDIKYKKFSNQNGPTYTINKSEVMAINYENGEKDLFDDVSPSNTSTQTSSSSSSSQRILNKKPDSRNSEIIASYNTIYQPTSKVKSNNKPAKDGIVIVGVKEKSIMSNEDIEMTIVRKILDCPAAGGFEYQGYHIIIKNKTNKVLYIDKGNCFRIRANGEVFCYYDNSEQTTVTNGMGHGASLGLGSVAGVLGIGGAAGQLAKGISVGGGSSHSVSTTYSQQRVIAIPPHGSKVLSEDRYVKTKRGSIISDAEYTAIETSEDMWIPDGFLTEQNSITWGLPRGIVNNGQIKTFGEDELPWKQEYYITYSTEEDFSTYSTLNVELYIHEIIGGGDEEDKKNFRYIEGANDHTLNNHISLARPKN